jgi:hypothetical protein
MELILKNINRPYVIQYGNKEFQKASDIPEGERVKIILPEQVQKEESSSPVESVNVAVQLGKSYIIKVRQYMTRKTHDDFDFMRQWNNDEPMPFRVMVGKVVKETRGMVMMNLHCIPLETTHCMRCGKELTHPVSKLYGVGPECGSHAYLNPFNTMEELQEALDDVKKKLASIQWRGWIIKTAITEVKEIKEEV